MDLKAAQASLSARTQALVNAPLRTEAMREAEQKIRMQRFPTVRVPELFNSYTDLSMRTDNYPCQVCRPHPAGEDLPLIRQDPLCVRVCPQFTSGGREAYKVCPM